MTVPHPLLPESPVAKAKAATRILVVDDEPLLCRMLASILQRTGYQVETAYNGADAVAAVKRFRPDLITLDVMMPGMSGIEVAQTLRADQETATIPIIFITALDRSVSQDLQRILHADRYTYHMDKPFNRQQLLIQVETALEARTQGQES